MTTESKVLAVWMTIWNASAMSQTDVAIELPQQPLNKALSALARQRGTDIIAPSGLMTDRAAPALKGRMTVREALGRLPRGTALDVEQRDGKTYVVILPKSTVSRPDTLSRTTTVLPPIVVRNQADSDTQGFVAESTTSATRTNAALIEVPQSIQVVNQTVIQSQQAQSVGDALHNISSVETMAGTMISMSGQASTDGSIYYRGKHRSATLGIKNIFNRLLYDDRGGERLSASSRAGRFI